MQDKYDVFINGKFVATVFDEDSAWNTISIHLNDGDVFEVKDREGKARPEFFIAY